MTSGGVGATQSIVPATIPANMRLRSMSPPVKVMVLDGTALHELTVVGLAGIRNVAAWPDVKVVLGKLQFPVDAAFTVVCVALAVLTATTFTVVAEPVTESGLIGDLARIAVTVAALSVTDTWKSVMLMLLAPAAVAGVFPVMVGVRS
jgi:hypothetical protein